MRSRGGRGATLGVPAAIVGVVVMMVLPLPKPLLDLLLAVNLTVSLVILLTALTARRALDFSVFPALLLVTTLMRLSLNISSTRLILTDGDAGKVIEAFGHVVVGGNLVVGLVIFLILVIVQFVVITAGAGRVAEVAARFTLDAMPGKQMAIDADLNSGLITDEVAKRRRLDVAREADFYGSMDGASKFVKGDAIAGIVIVVINLLGGFAVGIVQHGLTLQESISKYALLSVGDGLVSQVPALLISVASGIVVTRVQSDGDDGGLGTDLASQLMRSATALRTAAGSVAHARPDARPAQAAVPRHGGRAAAGGLAAPRSPRPSRRWCRTRATATARAPRSCSSRCASTRSSSSSPPTCSTCSTPRRAAASWSGSARCASGSPATSAWSSRRSVPSTRPGCRRPRTSSSCTASRPPAARPPPGTRWCSATTPTACRAGPPSTRCSGCPPSGCRRSSPTCWPPRAPPSSTAPRSSSRTCPRSCAARAGDLLTRQDVQVLVDAVKQVSPVVAGEIGGDVLSLSEVQGVLRDLLEEGVPVRDLTRILEAVTAKARTDKSPEGLVEAARGVLGPTISSGAAVGGRLAALTLEPLLEASLLEAVRAGEGGSWLALDPVRMEQLVQGIGDAVRTAEAVGRRPAIVCSAQLRPAVRRLVATGRPDLAVLAYPELARNLDIEPVGVIGLAQLNA